MMQESQHARSANNRVRNVAGSHAHSRALPRRGDERREHPHGVGSRAAILEGASRSRNFASVPAFLSDHPITTGSPPSLLQEKLAIGRTDDPLEHEAEQVADHVIRMPDPVISVASAPPQLSRKSDGGAAAGPASGEAPAIVHDVLGSSGRPLDAQTRAFFEPRLGRDFGDIRVHSGPAAEQSLREVSALAYTAGRNIVMDVNRFSPGSHEGRRLMAHELAHVVQQLPLSDASKSTSSVSTCLRRQPAPAAKPTSRRDPAPGLGPARFEEIENLVKAGEFQEAIDTLVGFKYMDYEIDVNLLAKKQMLFDPNLTSADAVTSMPSWDFLNNKADPPKVRIGPSAFSSVQYLYSVIMHEYQHVLWQQTLAHQQQSHKAHNEGFTAPDEVEAGAWELLNARETGVANMPGKIAQIWENLNKFFWRLDDKAQKSERPLVARAYQKAKDLLKTTGGNQTLAPFSQPSLDDD
jgi:hypothetical protein